MYKITKTYTDWNGVERKEDFFFNMTAAELAELQSEKDSNMQYYLQKIVDSKDIESVIKFVKKLLLMSYGEKSDDGRKFVKNDRVRENFQSHPAYSEIFMELATDANKASAFVNGITPADIDKYTAKVSNTGPIEVPLKEIQG